MIYVDNPYDPTDILFPRTTTVSVEGGKCGLVLRSSVGRRVFDLGEVYAEVEGDYFRVAGVVFCDGECKDTITPGEWEYQLLDGDFVLSSGLLRFGPLPFGEEPKQYNNGTTYDQYNGNAGNDY